MSASDMRSKDAFERITRLVARTFQAPIAVLSLVHQRQRRVLSAWGTPHPPDNLAALSQALCSLSERVVGDRLVILESLSLQAVPQLPRVAGQALVFYAGMPLRTAEGEWMGVLGMADIVPRQLTPEQIAILEDLAAMGVDAIALAQAKQQAQAAEAELRTLFSAMRDVVLVLDAEGRYLKVPPTSPALLSRPAAELVGKTVHEVLSPDRAEACLDLIRQVIETQRMVSAEYSIPIGDREVCFSVNLSPLSENSVLVVERDISELKRTEQERDCLRAQYEHLFHLSLDMLVIFDFANTVSHINPAWERTLGFSIQELKQIPLRELIHPEDWSATEAALRQLPQGRVLHDFENRYRCKQGTYRWLSWTAVPYQEEGMVYAVARDITDRKQAALQISQSLQEKEVLLREVHHRVKNNLQIISSLLDLQAQFTSDSALEAIFRESQNRLRSIALIHESLYRSETLHQIDMADYVEHLVGYLERSYRIQPDHIQFQLEIQQVVLELDQAIPCGLIINELVINALKHGFPQGQRGAIQLKLFPTASQQMILLVSNNGVDFPANINIQTSRTLGLQLVNSLVRQLGGCIQLERARGATFKIQFPWPPA